MNFVDALKIRKTMLILAITSIWPKKNPSPILLLGWDSLDIYLLPPGESYLLIAVVSTSSL